MREIYLRMAQTMHESLSLSGSVCVFCCTNMANSKWGNEEGITHFEHRSRVDRPTNQSESDEK